MANDKTVCDRPDACRIERSAATTTCIGWNRVYDGHGNLLTKDPNTTQWREYCSTCQRTWHVTRDAYGTRRMTE